MLKLSYTENGFYLESLNESLEKWIAKRVLLCLRAATSIYVEPSTASFLLPVNLLYLRDLEALQVEHGEIIELTASDGEGIEVSLQGTWVTSQEDSDEGVFVCTLSDRAESFLYQLWQEAQIEASVISE
jgi:hypothetical protein